MLSMRFVKHLLVMSTKLQKMPFVTSTPLWKRGRQYRDDDEHIFDRQDPTLIETIEELEDLNEFLSTDKSAVLADVVREEEKRSKRVLHAIIRRKYFKPAQEINLLTWDAKEQIRYLYQEFPDEWTIEKLSQSFPISEEGIKKLLKSKFFPHTVNDVIKHDRKVHKNWLAIKAADSEVKGGPIHTRYEALLAQGRLHTLKNAAGVQCLPHSTWQKHLLNKYTKPTREPGIFESIVKNYCEKKQIKSDLQERMVSEKEFLEEMKQENMKLLQDVTCKVTKRTNLLGPGQESEKESLGFVNKSHKELREAFTYYDRNIQTKETESDITDMLSQDSTQTLFKNPIMKKESEIQNQKHLHRTLRQYVRHGDNVNGSEKEIQMSGTGKTNMQNMPDLNKMLDADQDDNLSNYDKSTTFNDHSVEKRMFKSLKFARPKGKEYLPEVPYIYDETEGYQYPYGKPRHMLKRVKVPKEQKNKNVIYKKGKDYYGADGEFLFRIP